MEQPISPSFGRMVRLVLKEWRVVMNVENLIDLEEQLLRSLDFDLVETTPIPFLDRYLRIFGLDTEESSYLCN